MVVDKPSGVSSTFVTTQIKKIFSQKKVGHLGTLDPLATGVLPIALGEATKLIPYVLEGRKRYRFLVKWGEQTNTDDSEGNVTDTSPLVPQLEEIQNILSVFTGEIQQLPPIYSALKVNGERAYHLAREGKIVELSPRSVKIYDLTLLDYPDNQYGLFEVLCSKGTYVRSLARDLGLKLGTFGHIVQLRRLAAEPFNEGNAISLDSLKEMRHKISLASSILPLSWGLDDIPAVYVEENELLALRQGKPFMKSGSFLKEGDIARVEYFGKLVAISHVKDGMLWPKRVLNIEREVNDVD